METVTLLLGGTIALIFLFFTTKYTYWKRRNVPGPTPVPILGNYTDFFLCKRTNGEAAQKIYQQFPEEPIVGVYYGTEPALMARDPEVIKMIMTKEFYHFSGRRLAEHDFRDRLISGNLFFASGDNWKAMRNSFNPMFSSAKLKGMFSFMTNAGKKMEEYLDQKYKESDVQNMKKVAVNFTLEIIGPALFGTQFDTLTEEDSIVRKYAIRSMEVSTRRTLLTNIRETWPTLYYMFRSGAPGLDYGVGEFFLDLAKNSFEARDNKSVGRNDLVDFLLKFKELGHIEAEGMRNPDGESKLVKIEATEEMLASQVFIFFVAGFETSASTMSFALYELAKNPEVQKRLVEEIEEVLKKYNNEITYEAVQQMKYMEMVTSETLRKYPLVSLLTRECMSDFRFPKSGIIVEKGMRIQIPVWAIHYDPKYYPEPEQFDPERFSPEEVQKRPAYTFLGFGEGQRICIGFRFAKLQTAVGLATVLRKFKVERSSGTAEKLYFEPCGPVTTALSGMDVKLVPRN